ncbi:MAG: type II secretion system F family protein [Candidatus Eremiobacterota bacterium]
MRKISLLNLSLFTRQLATLMGAGLPITKALEVLARPDSTEPAMARVAEQVHADLCTGQYLSQAMSRHPDCFSPVFVSMLRIGERTGGLVEVLHMLSAWLERDLRLMRQVLGALTYPALVMGLTGMLTLTVFATVVPGFAQVFEQMGARVPWPTQLLLAVSAGLRNPLCWLLLVSMAAGAWVFGRERLSTPEGRRGVARTVLAVPALGVFLRDASLARYAAALSLLLRTGVDLITGLRLAAAASGNPLLEEDAEGLQKSLENGQTLGDYLAGRPELYTMMFVHLATVGEETSKLDRMFGRLAEHYDSEVVYRIQILSALLEPILLSFVSTAVAFTLIAILLPLYSNLKQL